MTLVLMRLWDREIHGYWTHGASFSALPRVGELVVLGVRRDGGLVRAAVSFVIHGASTTELGDEVHLVHGCYGGLVLELESDRVRNQISLEWETFLLNFGWQRPEPVEPVEGE